MKNQIVENGLEAKKERAVLVLVHALLDRPTPTRDITQGDLATTVGLPVVIVTQVIEGGGRGPDRGPDRGLNPGLQHERKILFWM